MSTVTLDQYLKEKQAQVLAHAHAEARLSGFCCLRCCNPLRVGATFCSACHHQFQWPCPAKANVPRNPQGEMQRQVVRQVFQDFRYAPLPTMPSPVRPQPSTNIYSEMFSRASRIRRWMVLAAISCLGLYLAVMVGYVMNLTAGNSGKPSHPSMSAHVSSQPGTSGFIPTGNP